MRVRFIAAIAALASLLGVASPANAQVQASADRQAEANARITEGIVLLSLSAPLWLTGAIGLPLVAPQAGMNNLPPSLAMGAVSLVSIVGGVLLIRQGRDLRHRPNVARMLLLPQFSPVAAGNDAPLIGVTLAGVF